MAKIAVGMVFLTPFDKADEIINEIQQKYDLEMLHVETSYHKLWIVKKCPKEVISNENE